MQIRFLFCIITDLIDNRTFIDIKLNGKPFRVMFDSGAGYCKSSDCLRKKYSDCNAYSAFLAVRNVTLSL